MKNLIGILFFLLSGWLAGQNFVFNPMINPDPDLKGISSVVILNNKGLANSNLGYCIYYNGNIWQHVGNQPLGPISGIKKPNNEIWVMSASINSFFVWNTIADVWQSYLSLPPQISAGTQIFFAYEENKFYLCGQKDGYGKIFQYNGTSFQEKTSDYDYWYSALYVKAQNNVLLTTFNTTYYLSKLYRFNGASLMDLYTFDDINRGNPKSICTYDKNIFFILTSEGDVYKWEDDVKGMSKIFSYPASDMGKYANAIIAVDNNNIFTYGKEGIRHINISTGVSSIVYQLSYNSYINSASYENGRAFFVGSHGVILEMLVINSVSNEEINQAFRIYPNPTSDMLNIDFPVFGIDEKIVEIFDVSGKLIVKDSFSSFNHSLDISGLTNGIYVISLSDKDGRQIQKKFVKK